MRWVTASENVKRGGIAATDLLPAKAGLWWHLQAALTAMDGGRPPRGRPPRGNTVNAGAVYSVAKRIAPFVDNSRASKIFLLRY